MTAEEFKIGWAPREAQQELLKRKIEELKNLQTIVLDMSLELEESSNNAMELKDPQAVKTYLEGLFHWVQCYVELYPHNPVNGSLFTLNILNAFLMAHYSLAS